MLESNPCVAEEECIHILHREAVKLLEM